MGNFLGYEIFSQLKVRHVSFCGAGGGGRQQLVQDFFNMKNQNYDSRKHLFDFFYHGFLSLPCAGLFWEIAQLPSKQ